MDTPAELKPSPSVLDNIEDIDFSIHFDSVRTESDIQATACDLYERGLDVFPLPSAREWLLKANQGKVTKHPYPVKMRKLYASRLHFDHNFVELFDHSNIGVMCGRTSGNLVAIDCDSQKSFDYVGKELTNRGIPFWAITSHRGGAFLMRLVEGEAQNIPEKAGKIEDIEVWGNSHYIVLPPSVHHAGTIYQWKSPEPRFCLQPRESIPLVNVALLEWLGVICKTHRNVEQILNSELPVPAWANNISRANVETWITGVQEGSRNACLTSLAYDLAGNSIGKTTALAVVLEAAGRCDPPYPERESKAIVKSAYKQIRTPARSYFVEYGTHAKTWQAASVFAKSFDWGSRQWTYETTNKKNRKVVTFSLKPYTVKQVFLSLIERAKLDGRITFRATVRETSVISNLQKMTVGHALKALTSAEFVRRAKSDDSSSLFSFVDYSYFDTMTQHCSNSVSNLEYSILPKTHAEKDLFGGGHLYTVWKYLLLKPERNAYQTAKSLKLPKSSVYLAFKKLQAMRLISYSHSEGLFYGEACTDTTLQILAVEFDRDGRSRRREEQYRMERARHLNREFIRAKALYGIETRRIEDKQRNLHRGNR